MFWDNFITSIVDTYFEKYKVVVWFLFAIFIITIVTVVSYFGLRDLHKLDQLGIFGSKVPKVLWTTLTIRQH